MFTGHGNLDPCIPYTVVYNGFDLLVQNIIKRNIQCQVRIHGKKCKKFTQKVMLLHTVKKVNTQFSVTYFALFLATFSTDLKSEPNSAL
jgi:hypothetical protein